MSTTTHSITAAVSSVSGGNNGRLHATAFSGGLPLTVGLQAIVRYRELGERASVITSGVPAARVRQILSSVLALPQMEGSAADLLRVDVHRPDAGRYQHDYGLSLAIAMVASLHRKSIGEDILFLGDLDLDGRVRSITAKKVDRLNDAVAAYEIETPLRIVCSPETATWVQASSTVVVTPALTLAEAVAAVWPGATLRI
jgi:predicted ATP-dependent serine protease